MFFASCDKKEDILDFTFNPGPKTYMIEVPAIPVAGDTTFSSFGADVNIDSILTANGAGGLELKSVKLKTLALTITNPSGATFDPIEEIEATFSANGLPDLTVASVSSIPAGATTVNMTVNNSELINYINSSSFEVTLSGETSSPTPAMTIQVDVDYSMTVGPK